MKNINMKELHVPSYYKRFSCIGGACEDSCCIGWQIPIDQQTLKKYKKVKDGGMRKRLDKELVVKKSGHSMDHVAKIKLKNNRCAFLTKEGWCDIYSHLGESYLSQTCTLYPRTINRIGSKFECSLTFSCPEALRCLFAEETPLAFETIPLPSDFTTITGQLDINQGKPKRWEDYFYPVRDLMIKIVQYRHIGIEERLAALEVFMKEVNQRVSKQQLSKLPRLLSEWTNRLEEKQLGGKVDSLAAQSKQAIRLLKEIRAVADQHKLKSERYKNVLSQVEEGYKGKEAYFVKGYHTYYKPFLEEYGYMIENYFVNYIIERGVPVDTASPIESIERLKAYEKLIRMHLIGMALVEEKLTPEILVLCIQSISKTFDHHEVYFNILQEKCCNI